MEAAVARSSVSDSRCRQTAGAGKQQVQANRRCRQREVHLEKPGEAGVSVGDVLRSAPPGLGQAADDQAQCAEGLVDLDALLQLLPHRA